MNDPNYERADLISKGIDGTGARELLRLVRCELASLADDDFDALHLKETLASHIGKDKAAKMRTLLVALAGNAHRRDVYGVIEKLGKEEAVRRLDRAISELTVLA